MHSQTLPFQLASNAKKRAPFRLALKVYLIFFIFLALIPVQTVFPFGWEAASFLVINVIFAFAGMKAAALRFKGGNKEISYLVNFELLSKIIILISTVGIALALVDRFVIRGVGFAQDAMEARAAIEAAGSGAIGMLAAFLSSFAAFGVISVWLAERASNKKNIKFSVLAYINLALYLYLSIMLGSRSMLMVVFLTHLSAKLLMSKKQNSKQFILFFFMVLFFSLSVLTALVLIFKNRLEIMGLSAMDSIQLSGYAFTLAPTDSVLNFIYGDEFLESFGAAAYSLILYAYHGIFEFSYLFNNFGSNHTHGSFTFWLPLKVFESVFGSVAGLDLESLSGYRPGVFTSFFGPLFLDFSLLAPLAAFCIFFFLSLPNHLVIRGKSQWVFWAIITEVIIIFSPAMSLIQSASGMYLVVAAACIAVFAPIIKLSPNA